MPKSASFAFQRAGRQVRGLEQHVRGLHVAVHDAAGVDHVQRLGEVGEQAGGIRWAERAVPQRLAQVAAVDELHDEELAVGRRVVRGVVEAHERAMREAREQRRLGAAAVRRRRCPRPRRRTPSRRPGGRARGLRRGRRSPCRRGRSGRRGGSARRGSRPRTRRPSRCSGWLLTLIEGSRRRLGPAREGWGGRAGRGLVLTRDASAEDHRQRRRRPAEREVDEHGHVVARRRRPCARCGGSRHPSPRRRTPSSRG